MTISVIVVTAINMGPVFTTQRTATTPGTSRPKINKRLNKSQLAI